MQATSLRKGCLPCGRPTGVTLARSVVHISSLPFYTVDLDARAGMPSLTRPVFHFARLGWRVTVFYPSYQRAPEINQGGLRIVPVYFAPYRWGRYKRGFWQRQALRTLAPAYMACFPIVIWRKVLDLQPHLIYAHGAAGAVVGTLLARRIGIPVVARLYGFSHCLALLGEGPRSLRQWYSSMDERLALTLRADLYVITDDGTHGKDIVRAHGLCNRALVLRNGVDPPRELPDADKIAVRCSLGVDPGKVMITYVGRLEEGKGCFRLLDVAREAASRGLPWVFILVGEGHARPRMESVVNGEHMEDMVRIVGPVPHDAVWKYLGASDVFVTLPEFSSISNTLLEALATRIPVVCSRRGEGIEELVREQRDGVLVDNPDDVSEVLAAIQRALQVPRHLRSGLHPGIWSWEQRLAREFEAIYGLLEKWEKTRRS